MRHEISAIRAGGSELPATANLMYDYDGLDYKKFKDVMDIVSWDNYPSWHKKDEYAKHQESTVPFDGILSFCNQLEAHQQTEEAGNASGGVPPGSCSWFR